MVGDRFEVIDEEIEDGPAEAVAELIDDAPLPVRAVPVARLKEAEAAHIARALESTGGHRMQTAELLGISRKVLWEKMRDLDLEAPGNS